MNSIWGVIILGAIGSIAATCLIKLFKKLYGLYHYSRYKFKVREYNKGVKGGAALGYILKKRDTNFAIIFMLYRFSRLVLSCTSLVLIISTLSYLASNKDNQVLTIFSFLFSVLLFLNFRWIYEEYREVKTPYKKYVLPVLNKLSDDFYKRKAD